MMTFRRQTVLLCLSLALMYTMFFITFLQIPIFWYFYPLTILIAITIAFTTTNFKDELPTWQYLIYGIGYGTLAYVLIRFAYLLLPIFSTTAHLSIEQFLLHYRPNTMWHFFLLWFVISIGEELFWRGYVQQYFRIWFTPLYAALIAAFLFALAVSLSGFFLGAVAAFFIGLFFGLLYEWKKSLPLLIIAHITFTALLFLVLPLQ